MRYLADLLDTIKKELQLTRAVVLKELHARDHRGGAAPDLNLDQNSVDADLQARLGTQLPLKTLEQVQAFFDDSANDDQFRATRSGVLTRRLLTSLKTNHGPSKTPEE